MNNGSYNSKEQAFFIELVKDIQNDIYTLEEDPNKVYLTLRQHLNNVNNRVSNSYTTAELLQIEQSIKDAVRDFTDLDLNTYLCSGVVVLSEYLDQPEEIMDYVGKLRK